MRVLLMKPTLAALRAHLLLGVLTTVASVEAHAAEFIAIPLPAGATSIDAYGVSADGKYVVGTAGGKASMLQDIEAGRRTEIDTISGAAVRLSDKHGLPAPLNRAMFALVKGREAAMGIVS